MNNTNLGYDKDFIITIRMPEGFSKQYNAFNLDLLQNSNITNITAASNLPNRGFTFSNDRWDWEGKNPEQNILIKGLYVDYDYFETFNIDFKYGRPFSHLFDSDTSNAIIINESTMQATGIKDPIGKWFGGKGYRPLIVGVTKDYHFQSLHTKIEPLGFLFFGVEACNHVRIKIQPENVSSTIQHIGDRWNQYSPNYPFEFNFLDESISALYLRERQVSDILKYFTILVIFISSIGLLGLSALTTTQRTKEIGVRKVLGASVKSVLFLLTKDFSKWVILANLFAWPVSFFVINEWLQNFAYRIDISIWPFLFSAAFVLTIALVTMNWYVIRAATSNPINALRYE